MISVAEAIDADTLRIRHEFLTLPDLRTSPDACAHLLNVSPTRAARILDSLVRDGFLECSEQRRYARRPTERPTDVMPS